MFSFIGEGIFTQDGEPWRHSRELLRRPFLKAHYQDLKGFLRLINCIVISQLPISGTVDLQPFFSQYTLATTTELLFGQLMNDLEMEEQTTFVNSFNHASFISSLRMRLVDFYWLYQPQSYNSACINVKKYADKIVQRALKQRIGENSKHCTENYGFIEDLYLELQDPVLVRDQLVNVLLAGRDTTACLLSWTL